MKIQTEFESRRTEPGRVKSPNVVQKRALVVDDEPAMRELIQEVLKGVDIEAVPLGKSSDADRYFNDEKFDLVVIGLCGPAGDGIDLVKKIRGSSFNHITPIILISGDQRPAALSQGFAAGATFFAYKPIDRPHLMRLIRASHGAMETERRRFRRVPIRAKVRIKSDNLELEGETINISLNGALITAPRMIEVGSLVEISLYLFGGGKPIVGLGTVVRILDGNQMGIVIDRISSVESGRLQEFLLPRTSD